MEQFDNTVRNALSFIDNNEYLSAAVSLFLILYAGLAAPKLPGYIARLFDNPLFKLLIFFLIAYSARKNPTVAIIASVGLMVSLHTLTRYKVNVQMVSLAQEEAKAAVEEEVKAAVAEEVPAEAVEGMEEEPQIVMDELDDVPCAKRADFRDSFYPQYVNMKPDAYQARYSNDDVSGYDVSAKYASL